jgi:hypothetical protein
MQVNYLASALAGVAMLLSAALLTPGAALADGGAGPEAMSMGNMCMVMFGYDMIHITSYLPGKSRSEYCEEIPGAGKVIMVFDIENPRFRDLPIEIRIIRDPLTPLQLEADLEPMTEVHFPPTQYKKGTFSFEHDYTKNGHYIALVTLTKENGEKETQALKFSVGETLWQYVPFILGGILIGLTLWAYWRHSHTAPKPKPAAE